jgi:hypothetical protein
LEPGHQDYFDPAPGKDDGLMLARSVTLPSIQFVLESMRNGSMYTLEQAKRCVEQNVFKKDSLHTVSHGPGGRIVRKDGEEDDMVVSAAETPIREEDINNINNLDDSDVEDDTNQTMYARNGVVSDIPLKLDLNEHTTVQLLIDSVEDLRKRCLDGTSTIGINAQGEVEAQGPSLDPDNIKGNPWSDNGWPVEDWPIPWMADRGVYLCGDGSPTFAALSLLRGIHWGDKDFPDDGPKVTPFNGGFHAMLELHKLRGKAFGPTHLREIWSAWRTTEGTPNWVMNPGDPNDVEDEMAMYYFGVIAGAITALMEKKQAEGKEDEGVSAIEVFDFMKTAAENSPIVQNLYNEIRFAEVVFLLQQAEEEGNAETYVTAMRFCSLLFATTHATKYCNMAAEFLIWWHFASAAERVIYEKFLMVRKTRHGNNIYTDRFVEWVVKDMRSSVGKFYVRGSDNAIEREALLLGLKKEFIAASTSARQNDPTTRGLGQVYCHTLAFMDKHKVWSTVATDASRSNRIRHPYQLA